MAVAAVLAFHAGFGWASGGYVGVSVFFTLSGYLITSLALVERDRHGRFSAGAFYARRIRRLLPASLLCLVLVITAAFAGQFRGVTNLRRDIWAALAQVYNWAALAAGDDYAHQTARAAGQRAPLDHYWSLSVEEQFYWVWPVVLLLLLRRTPRRRVVLVAALGGAAAVTTLVVSAVWGAAATYLATPARLAEILAGGLLAVVLHRRRGPLPAAVWLLAVAGLAVVAWATVAWPAAGGPAYEGWLPVFALASVGLVAGLQVASPARVVLSWAPLVALGRISYGVYLFHWPVYTIVDERRLAIGRTGLFAVRVAITLVIAAASFVIVERPVRRRHRPLAPTAALAGAACVALAAVTLFVPDRGGTYTYVAAATRVAAAIPPVASGEELAPLGQRPLRVLVAGDSTAVALGSGLVQWAAEHPDELRVTVAAGVGCGLNAAGGLPDDDYREACERLQADLPRLGARLRPDVVVAMVTFRDMEDRQFDADEGVLTPADPRFRRHLLDGYRDVVQSLLDAGAGRVVWLVPPVPALPPVGDLAPMLDPARLDAYRQVLRALPLSSPAVEVADLAAWMGASPDPPERADGLHLTLDGAVEVATDFLLPLLAGP